MMWFLAVLAVLVLGAVALVAAGRGAPLAPEHGDRPDVDVPTTRALTGADLRGARFPLAFRGYRMGGVDALLDRLARELEQRPAAGAPPYDASPHDASPHAGRGDGAQP